MPKTDILSNNALIHQVGPDEWPAAVSYLPHCVQLPREASLTRPTPVVVMIHGWGGDEYAMWAFKQAVPASVALITPRAPFDLNEGGYCWYQRDESRIQPEPASLWAGVDRLHRFLVDLPHQYPLDPTRLVLIGFSQGAAMASTLAIRQPGLAIGVASLSGLIPDLVAETAVNDSLAGFSVFVAHGVRDEIIPLSYAHQTRQLYTRLGAQVTYGEYSTGHKLTTQGIAELKQWLARVIEPVPLLTL